MIPRVLVDREVAHRGLTELHVVESMHERKAKMAELSDGFIALPGGIGTLEELIEVYTWSYLGIHSKPLGLVNTDGYYDGLTAFLDHSVTEGFLRPQTRASLLVAPDARGAAGRAGPRSDVAVSTGRDARFGAGVAAGIFALTRMARVPAGPAPRRSRSPVETTGGRDQPYGWAMRAVVLCAVFLALPSSAHAATLVKSGSTLTYTAAPGRASTVTFSVPDPGQPGSVRVARAGDGDPIQATGCAPAGQDFTCTGIERIVAALGDGTDFADARTLQRPGRVRRRARRRPAVRRGGRGRPRAAATATTCWTAAPATTRSVAARATTRSTAAPARTRSAAGPGSTAPRT